MVESWFFSYRSHVKQWADGDLRLRIAVNQGVADACAGGYGGDEVVGDASGQAEPALCDVWIDDICAGDASGEEWVDDTCAGDVFVKEWVGDASGEVLPTMFDQCVEDVCAGDVVGEESVDDACAGDANGERATSN